MHKESTSRTALQAVSGQEDVVLNLTISGAREQILYLLEQMDSVPGFSIVKGSFVVSNTHNPSM